MTNPDDGVGGEPREPSRQVHPGTDIAVVEGAVAGTGGGEILFENDRVRITSVSLAPGERSALHTHVLDYILVQIEAGEACHEPHPLTQGRMKQRKISKITPGLTAFIPRGGTEVAINTGNTILREISIELK